MNRKGNKVDNQSKEKRILELELQLLKVSLNKEEREKIRKELEELKRG